MHFCELGTWWKSYFGTGDSRNVGFTQSAQGSLFKEGPNVPSSATLVCDTAVCFSQCISLPAASTHISWHPPLCFSYFFCSFGYSA